MAFSKEVALTVESRIDNLDDGGVSDGSPEITSLTLPGWLFYDRKGYFAVRYVEGKDETRVDCDVEVNGETVTVHRRGAVVCDLELETGVARKTVYKVPPYAFDLAVTARKIRNELTPDGGTLDLFYRMDLGGAGKDARLKITVSVKKS